MQVYAQAVFPMMERNSTPSDKEEMQHQNMEKVLANIVALVKSHQAGIPVKKLSLFYNQEYCENLSVFQLGFNSTTKLVESLKEELVVEGGLVFYRQNRVQAGDEYGAAGGGGGEDGGGARAMDPRESKKTKKVQRRIAEMVSEHPDGIPLEKLAFDYTQAYKRLDVGPLGFDSMSGVIESMPELAVRGNVVFHKGRTSLDEPAGVTGAEESGRPTPESRALTQDQLHQRVLEVTTRYQLAAPSMEQLQSLYVGHFGELFPLQQYMSLYSSLESKKLQSRLAAEANTPPPPPTTTAWNTPAANHNPQAELQKSVRPVFLSGVDFPALGLQPGTGAEQKSRARKASGGGRKDGAAAVFRDGYHAQLRETLGGNMRAAEATEQDKDARAWRNRAADAEQVNSLVAAVIRELAAEGEFVTKEKVICQVCRLDPSLDPGRLNHKVPALRDLQYLIREVNMFIECTEAVTSICTLYELGQSLAGLKDKKHYEELHLGPLCKLPLVHRMFKIASDTKDDDIHQIETVDILKQLRNFRRKNSKALVDLAEFLKYLADQYNCGSPYELGIRIHSVGLPIATLGKVSRNEHSILEQARATIQQELEEETLERLRKLKKSIFEPTQGGGGGTSSFSSAANQELRKKYAALTAAEVVLAVFTNSEGVFNPRMTKEVQSFLLKVSGDRLATALFQLAICGGSLATPQDLVAKEKPAKAKDQPKAEERDGASLPSEAKVKHFLKESLAAQNSVVTLAHIASLEKKVAKHFHVKDFLSLDKGSFLDFLVKNIQLLQDTLGSALILSGSGAQLAGTGFRPSRQDVFEFIKQCGDVASTDPEELSHLESALRSHYGVRDSRDLGLGPLHMLADLVQRQRKLSGGGLSPVYYESALFAKHGKFSAEGGCESVGRLGETSKAQALTSLLSCPLLEDLSQWSQWKLVFQPQHGPLKDFIEKNAADTGLAALEVSPGLLLRITTHTSDKHFLSAAKLLDPVGTAGHLVSTAVANGVVDTPAALLANHMESSLVAAVAKEDLSQAEEDVSCYGRVARFLLACLTRIPARTCQALLQQVILEPFSRAVGQAKSKEVLITVAQADPKHRSCLHRLGILTGVSDWVKDYRKTLNPELRDGYGACPPPAEQAKSNLIGSQSSSRSALNMSEDEFSEDSVKDDSFASSQLDQSTQQVNNDIEIEAEEEEEEDEEELYELVLPLNGVTSDVSSEADGAQGEEERQEKSESDEDDGCRPEVALSPQRAIIEDIRKSEFGIGVELNAEGQKLMQVHQDRLGRSLDRLSTELYSKDTHFVLELIQNADDNSYPSEAGVTPALAFLVEKDCITVLNNEIGFQEKNIRAICDVGRSTKGKHKYGYIGQKGIGFKSVFKVTDCPEIHSNGFHLRFDKTCGPMGYILPHWADDERPLGAQLEGAGQHRWTTKIGLPLRSESHQTKNLFHDVHPSLLLFLHRLRSITIYNQSDKRAATMTRRDLSHNVLEVEHAEGVERWLVVKSTLRPKKIKEDVECTELALAFQLAGGDIAGSDAACQPQQQPVFAYLPLRSFGFRFIIQADFDIPSSREDVDRDSTWNQWLRSEIPQLFLQAMDVFTDHPDFTGLKGLCHFLQFVPLPDEGLDFFKPVAGQIIQLLKGKAFLPTRGSDGEVAYKLPSQVAVCQDAVIRDVIGGDELERHLSLSYLHPGLSPSPPASLLAHLGVRNLRGSDVTTVTTAMAKELMKVGGIHTEEGLHQLARLLVCNFRTLEHGYGEADSVLDALKDLPIIPLADGRAVALSGEGVFFPMEESSSKKKKAQPQKGPLSALYQDVSVVHPSLLNCLEPLESQQVRELLRRLGVHELEPQELLEQHIYPTIRNNRWKSKSQSVVVSYLVFIKQHSASAQDYSDIAIPVLTSRGLLCPTSAKVHFSEDYGNIDLPKKLPGHDWILLSPCYVQTDGDVAGWRELFGRLGVWDGLVLRKERLKLSAADLARSPWSVESTKWHQAPGEGCLLDDYPCEEFHSLATAQLPGPQLLQQRAALLELLETNWDTGHHYSQYLTAQVIDEDGRPVRSTRSSFYHYLCRLEWLPAYRLQPTGQRERRYLCPGSVYLASPEVHGLLGTHVDYVDLESSEFSRALAMRETISVEVLISYLKEWCVRPQADDDEELRGASFTSTAQHIHNIYTYLQTKCSHSSLKELFQHTPAVFVESARLDDDWSTGRFYHLKEVCWSDPTRMFQRYRRLTKEADSPVQKPRVLAPFYEPLKDFFLTLLNVDRSPNMKQYVGLLEVICASSPMPTAEVLQDVSVLYARLARKCEIQVAGDQESVPQRNLSYCSTLKGMVSDKKVFPTKDHNWVTLARKPMVSDSKELEKIFKSDKRVCLLNLPPAEKKTLPSRKTTNRGYAREQAPPPAFDESDRLSFMEICGVRRLSDCVKCDPQTEVLQPCPSMQALARAVVPYIQRFLCRHDELDQLYGELVEGRVAAKIRNLYFAQVEKLYIRYQLDLADGGDPVIELQDVICLLIDDKNLYIQKDHLSAQLDICRELVKLFCTESSHRKDLMHFLSGLIASLSDPRALQRFLAKEDVRELPSEEEPWEIPEPAKPEVPLGRVLPRTFSSSAASSHEEAPRPAQADGEQTLMCWPPRASIQPTGSGRTAHADSSAVEAVMKRWPPPAPPKDRDLEREGGPRASADEGEQPPRSGGPGSGQPADHQSPPGKPNATANASSSDNSSSIPPPPECGTQSETAQPDSARPAEGSRAASGPKPPTPPAAAAAPSSLVAPEAVVLASTFQGSAAAAQSQRPPLVLDFPAWPQQATLEDVELDCQRPSTVVLSDDQTNMTEIGDWGEQLVYSFLCHWRDGGDQQRPTQVLWCNQSGESGQPYDFEVTFGAAGAVYVEVKSTVKREKAFIHLSANELDFALKEKERYHLYRVYSAGDAHNVRLCRIRNLAQQLHTKDVALFLFV